jgi:hypothetical protein
MRKAAVVLGFLYFTTLSLGQESKQPEAKLVRSPFAGGDIVHVIQEAALDLREYASGADDMVAIRVCSKEPLPVALSISAASPFIILEYLEHYGFSRERVLLMRSESCLGENQTIAVTEFWAIPKGAAPPPSVESIKSSQARLEVVRTEDTIKSANGYRAALRQFIAKLRAKPEATGLVVGSYNENPNPTLEKNLGVARRVLEQSGLSEDRYFVRLTPPTSVRSDEPAKSEPKYPNLFVVKVAKPRERARR